MFAFLIAMGMAVSGPAVDSASTNRLPETFYYATTRKGDESRKVQELVRLELHPRDNAFVSVYRSDRDSGSELVLITTEPNGKLLSATKIEQDSKARETVRSRIWLDGDKVYVERRRSADRRSVKQRDVAGSEVVADAGLLFWLRRFPFDSGKELEILMASFSQHFVRMKVRQVGRETISVQGGTFECYRLEGIVDLLVKEIVTTYWISVEAPHFLVQYEGKRGIFIAPTFTTRLLRFE